MSISDQRGFISDLGGSFTEDAPRPPVPGEEGELVCNDGRQHSNPTFSSKNEGTKSEASVATPRRPDLDLGYEPEGSASPTPPYLKWAESLHSLLDDQDGIHLFRKFLKQEDCADMLDFWFACSGFRKLDASEGNEEKKVKLAKAIYKKYIQDNNRIVSRQIKPATKSFIRDCLMRLHIDPAMFDQAQTEIQSRMEENTYPLFLKSDIYLEYTRTGGESPKLCSEQSSVSGTEKGVSGYLPTLNEYEEWRCDKGPEETECDLTPSSQLTQRLLMETVPRRVASSAKFQDSQECRHGPCREPTNPYYVNVGHVLAPATSANDSEQQSMSSDAETLSLTDSSVDGVPPYRYRKQHRREMHESAKANGRVPLPHFPRTNRIPKDIHVEPERFAAELIGRLEGVLREREAEEKLEERLRRVRLGRYIRALVAKGAATCSHSTHSFRTLPCLLTQLPAPHPARGGLSAAQEEKIKSGALQPKQRYVMEVIQRGRAAVRPSPVPVLNVVPAVSDGELSEPEHKATKKQACENITVAYYFCEELIPYRTSVRGRVVTLGQFKELLTKKGNYRYYFKKVSDEFDCGVVFEEVREDDAVLPVFEEKIIGKVEKVD